MLNIYLFIYFSYCNKFMSKIPGEITALKLMLDFQSFVSIRTLMIIISEPQTLPNFLSSLRLNLLLLMPAG